MTATLSRVPAALLLLIAVACTEPVDTDSLDTDSDRDPDSDGVACMDLSTFAASYNDRMCAFAETCPEPFFDSRAECRSYNMRLWSATPCWKECMAAECAEWLLTDPTCDDPTGRMIDACEMMYQQCD